MVATKFIAKPPGDAEIVVLSDEVAVTLDAGSADREDIRVDVSPHRIVVGIKGFSDRVFKIPVEINPEDTSARAVNSVLCVVAKRTSSSAEAPRVIALPVQSQLDGAGVNA